MFKNIFKTKEEKLIFKVSIRPFIIFCLAITIIVTINSVFNKLSEDTINGYICCMILNMLIIYLNLSFMELENEFKNKNTDEENKKEEN